MTGQPPNVLLAGIVGSTAYGLAGPDSDTDRLGVFAYPTESLVGLARYPSSAVSVNPDATFHEAGKMAALLLKCNPTVTELLWLPDDLYEKRTAHGDGLLAVRGGFLSRKYVRDAYLGYATAQFRKLASRGDGSFSSDTRKRTAKHARHLARLLAQGRQLHATGRLRVKLDDPAWFLEFGEKVAAGDTDIARQALAEAEAAFDTVRSPLREFPDGRLAEGWLQDVRRAFYARLPQPEVQRYDPDPDLPLAVLCDIDGTLAIHGDRSPYDYARCGEDALNEPVAEYLHLVSGRMDEMREIILLSGRPETARGDTEAWLSRHIVPHDELHMRAAGDYRSDVIVKNELFDRHVRDRFRVSVVLDDRNRVVSLWRQLGLPCWQVNEGDF